MSSSPEHDSIIIHKLLTDRSVPAKEDCLAKEHPNVESVEKLYDDILAIRETLSRFAKGDFDAPLTGRGAVWGHLKALQANLKHLAWQVEQVAAGDLSQRVEFMGDFSAAFNKMVLQLENSLEEMKNREAAERMQIMFDATPLCVSFWNEQHEILDCNLEAVKLHELSSKQEYLERFFDLMPERQSAGQLSAEIFHKTIKETFEKGYARYEFACQQLNGAPMPVEITLVRVMQQGDYIVACYIRDLRELKQKEAALEQERLLLLDVINASPICFAILVDGKAKFSSAFMKHFIGFGIDDDFVGCFANPQQGIAVKAKVQKDVHIEWEPVTLCTKEGEYKEMLANLFQTNYYGERGVIVWLVDITELKKIENDLRAAKEIAEHLGRVKDEFIANISHELRTPMNAVIGGLHLLHSTGLSEEQTSFAEIIETSAKQLMQFINNMLDFSQFESGKIFMASEDFDIRETLDNVLSLFRDEINAKHLQLLCSVDDDVPAQITGDPARLQQVLHCLVDNAVKFTAQGSVQIHVHIESTEDDNIVLWFSVRDTGIGMSPENQTQIFQPFSRADSSETRKFGGTGLGLSVAKNLVEMMGGRIWCTSELEQGSTFFFLAEFKLPRDDENKSVVFPEAFQDLPILLAEDNKVNQIVATRLLQKKGFQVDVAPDGLQAVEMTKQKDYALILMDIQMPEMDGVQAVLTIRSDAKYATLPIIALTANAMEDDRRRYMEAGMNDLVGKPIDPKILYRAILKWAKHPAPPQQHKESE